MHNLRSKFDTFFQLAKSVFAVRLDPFDNLRNYSNRPKLSDIQILAISLAAESLQIASENALYFLLEVQFPDLFRLFPHRTNFNRRRKALRAVFDEFATLLADDLTAPSNRYIIDSIPLPICRFARFSRLKIMQANPGLGPRKGYLPIDKNWFAGFKIHAVCSDTGVVVNYVLTQAHVHDVTQLSELSNLLPEDCELLGDKGYISEPVQLALFEQKKVRVITPSRKNQRKPNSAWKPALARARKRIETVFSQLVDFLNIKRNYAKEVDGFLARITTKITTFTALQFLNHEKGRPLNHVKNPLPV
jgi:hypothetical protein